MPLLNTRARRRQRLAGFAFALLASLPHHALAQPVTTPASAPAPVPVPVPERTVGLRWIGSLSLPTGTLFEGTEFGGISGLDRAPDGTHWALSDDRERPRVYALRIELGQAGLHAVHVDRVVKLLDANGQPLAARTADPEAMRLTADGQLLVASEGHWSANPAQRHQPFLQAFTTDGKFNRAFELPPGFGLVDNATTGARNNKGIESLAVVPHGAVFAAVEDALITDGAAATFDAGSWLRVIRFDPASGTAVAQHAYALPPIPLRRSAGEGGPPAARGSNGLTDWLALSDTSFIAVERAYVPSEGVTVRLVLIRIESDTTDVSRLPSLAGAAFVPMRRELLLEMAVDVQGERLDNIEAIAWGPVLANGNRSLILVSDNNFSRLQTTQFLALEMVSP